MDYHNLPSTSYTGLCHLGVQSSGCRQPPEVAAPKRFAACCRPRIITRKPFSGPLWGGTEAMKDSRSRGFLEWWGSRSLAPKSSWEFLGFQSQERPLGTLGGALGLLERPLGGGSALRRMLLRKSTAARNGAGLEDLAGCKGATHLASRACGQKPFRQLRAHLDL